MSIKHDAAWMVKIMINNESLKTDDGRLLVKDDYGNKYYEIIEDNSHTSVYCYTRNRFLDEKEIKDLKIKYLN